MRWTKHIFKMFSICLVILLTTNSCQDDGLSMYNPILSASNEEDLGNALHGVLMNNPDDFPILAKADYPAVYHLVDEMIRMVKDVTNIRDKYEWEVIIIHNDDSKNAFTLPGGKVVITTGFLKFLHSGHQLFSLIAHEAYYTDRIDQNGAGELSIVMQKLKASDKYLNLGTKIFLDVIDGNSLNEGKDMVQFCMDADYESYEVLAADQFALSTICDNYLYSAYGIREIIEAVDNDPSIIEFAWFENKPPLPNTLINPGGSIPNNTTIAQRIANINNWVSDNDCGTLQDIDDYNNTFLAELP